MTSLCIKKKNLKIFLICLKSKNVFKIKHLNSLYYLHRECDDNYFFLEFIV